MSFLLLLMILGLKPIVSLLSLIVAGTLEGVAAAKHRLNAPHSESATLRAIVASRAQRLNLLSTGRKEIN